MSAEPGAKVEGGPAHTVIVGSGFAGIAMGIALKRAGIDEFTIFEKAPRVGGTWRDNDYPGAACDVESHLYSFSFEPWPEWTRTFAPQREILAYLERCVDKYGLRPHLRLSTAVTGADFDTRQGIWQVTTTRGTLSARVIVSCGGGLSRPAYAAIDGLEDFSGKIFHSARWDHDYPLAGKNVAVIGTGASAIQIVPAIAGEVGRLHVFQRTPPWIVPRVEREITAEERARFRQSPARQRLRRLAYYWRNEIFVFGLALEPRIMKVVAEQGRRHLAQSVPDPALRAKLEPRYVMGCKRILLSNDYYPALQRANVELVTAPIARVTPSGIVTGDGQARSLDAIVLATGFHAADMTAPFAVRGRGGRDLDGCWRESPEAFNGTSVAGFPNLFFIVGPNTGLGHTSMIFMIEAQARYISDAICQLRRRGWSSLEVRPEVQARFNEKLQARLARTVWNTGGCASWYRTPSGKNTTLWPGFTFEFWLRTRRFNFAHYQIRRVEAR